MNSEIISEIIEKHETADSFVSLFFALIDMIIYIVILFIFGCEFNKKFFSHRQKLSLLLILDVVLRIINLYINTFIYSLLKELFINLIVTLQFYLMILLLNQIFTDKNNENLLESLEIKDPFLTSVAFFMLAFILNISKIISFIKYIFAIIAILGYGYYISIKIDLFLINVEKKNPYYYGQIFASNMPQFIIIYFILYYIFKILILFIKNKLYISYMEMASDIFKEVGKYLSFCLVITTYYLFNKYIKEEDYHFANSSNQGDDNISSINIKNDMNKN